MAKILEQLVAALLAASSFRGLARGSDELAAMAKLLEQQDIPMPRSIGSFSGRLRPGS
jgi:hypothetical protein